MKEQILYFECYSGISGDMTVAALLDLGADEKVLLQGLASLCVDGYHILISRVKKNGIDACDFDVMLAVSDIDKNNALIIGQHMHRNLYDIQQIIDASGISEKAKKIAKNIFQIVAVAESKAHNLSLEAVYFHELGATDSIVDIVATAICLDNLNITDMVCSDLYDGTGYIPYRFGMLPVPVPAVMEIISEHSLPLHITTINGELITPTGAAIVASIRTMEKLPQRYKVNKVGIGAGKRAYENAGVLRAMLIETYVQ